MSSLCLSDLQDDLESFFYVILFFTLQYLPVRFSQVELVDLMESIFEESKFDPTLGMVVGGHAKARLLLAGDSPLVNFMFLANSPMNAWMEQSWDAFEQFHNYLYKEQRRATRARIMNPANSAHSINLANERPTMLAAGHIYLCDHDHFLKIFEDVLALEDWSDLHHTRAAMHQFVNSELAKQRPGTKWMHE
ncbi:unnamed protein product [Cyclocybe aegerita]|uniref:Uncharacterized protein n=1 Tax=Cyclocybe aegerita TaxID=1973307 RepID=A0A8S0WYS0_CYCAE|nr:unnamed protein product [Cyclocybe aegerita]